MTKNEAKNLLSGTIVSNKKKVKTSYGHILEVGYDYRVIDVTDDVLSLEIVMPCIGVMPGKVFKIDLDDIEQCDNLYIKDETKITKDTEYNDGEYIDGYKCSSETITLGELKRGDVVLDSTGIYRTLTRVGEDVANYFSDGRFWSLPYDKCVWLVRTKNDETLDIEFIKIVE